jgi:uncharacterized protein DUF4034
MLHNLVSTAIAPRSLSRVACTVATGLWCALAQAQIGSSSQPMPGPQLVTCTNMELMKQVPCPDSALLFHEGRGLVQSAFNAKDFKRLDELYDQWCTGKDRFPDGRWKLSQYGDGLDDNFTHWNTWTKDLTVIQTWQQSRPWSKAALYAEAIYWRAYAWKARGGGYAHSVSKEGWELFRERLAKSKDILAALQAGGSECAAPYALTLSVLTDLGAREEQLAAVFTGAVREYPEYHNIYFAMARHYEPKWGGSAEQYGSFADQVAEQTKGFEGMGLYARLYWLVDNRRGIPFTNDPSRAPDWRKLQAGYEDLMRLYPSSMHNLGKYAGVACRSTDGELYRSLRSKIAGYEHTAEMLDPVDVCDRRHKWTPPKE